MNKGNDVEETTVSIEGLTMTTPETPTVQVHPLGEILSKKLFGIETVPPKEAKLMVNRAIKAAMEYVDRPAPKGMDREIIENVLNEVIFRHPGQTGTRLTRLQADAIAKLEDQI